MRGIVVPEPTEDFTADPVELYFDLAFVFAFSQLVYLLVHHPSWQGAGEALLLFAIIWLAWSTFTWAANAVSGNAREVRVLFLIATVASIPMGASITTAFGSGGPAFGFGASIIISMGIGIQLWGFSGDSTEAEFRTVATYALPNMLAMSILIGGTFVDGQPRKVLWTLFLAVVATGIARAHSGNWIVRAAHFAERHGLIVIIAIGEVIIANGTAVVASFTDPEIGRSESTGAIVAAGSLAGLLWWSYFDRFGPAIEHKATELQGNDRSRFIADVFTGYHFVIVAGIIGAAAAAEDILLHPTKPVPTEFAVMFIGGLVLFYVGIAGAVHRAYGVIAFERLIALAAIIAVGFVGQDWHGVALLIVVDLILFVMLYTEHRRVEATGKPAHRPDA